MSSVMSMKADIYKQQNVQDPNTKAIIRQWVYDRTIQCRIEPVKVKGASTRTDNKNFGTGTQGDYNEKVQFCLLYTSPSPRDRQKSRMPSSA